jgi:hypothetical protein
MTKRVSVFAIFGRSQGALFTRLEAINTASYPRCKVGAGEEIPYTAAIKEIIECTNRYSHDKTSDTVKVQGHLLSRYRNMFNTAMYEATRLRSENKILRDKINSIQNTLNR